MTTPAAAVVAASLVVTMLTHHRPMNHRIIGEYTQATDRRTVSTAKTVSLVSDDCKIGGENTSQSHFTVLTAGFLFVYLLSHSAIPSSQTTSEEQNQCFEFDIHIESSSNHNMI